MRSRRRSRRALAFDVVASGPLLGSRGHTTLIYGGLYIRGRAGIDSADADLVFGVPLALRLLAHDFFLELIRLRFGCSLVVCRLGWEFSTALNLLHAGQLDCGHILRFPESALANRWVGWLVPAGNSAGAGIFPLAGVWVWAEFCWVAISANSTDFTIIGPWNAPAWCCVATLLVMIFMFLYVPGPLWESATSH